MVGKDGAETRRGRLERMGQAIQKALYQSPNGEIPLNTTVVTLALTEGLTKQRALEYLNLLSEAGQFEIDLQNDKIKKPTA